MSIFKRHVILNRRVDSALHRPVITMGNQFSAGAWRKEISSLVDAPIVQLRAKIFHLDRLIDPAYEEKAFLTKKQVQLVFKLSDRKTFDVFNIFDPRKTGRIARVELFGALALAASDTPSEKVGLGFLVADEDKDEYLSPSDLKMLIVCATRGISAMKNLDCPPEKSINKIMNFIFKSESITLNEKGYVSVTDLKAFCQTNDLCRTYFADLGTQIEAADPGKLIDQRKKLQIDLVRVETSLRNLQNKISSVNEDHSFYSKERGGDSLLLKFSAEDIRDDVDLDEQE